MHMFQQRLDETAVMAQLLMEQQVVGQSARRLKDTSLPKQEVETPRKRSAGLLAAMLEADEASTAKEVIEYAQYLGMDPEQVSNPNVPLLHAIGNLS